MTVKGLLKGSLQTVLEKLGELNNAVLFGTAKGSPISPLLLKNLLREAAGAATELHETTSMSRTLIAKASKSE